MDDLTPQQRRCNMQHIKSRDTKPELTLRRALWHSGLRGHRKNYQALPGKPDIAYTRYKIEYFIFLIRRCLFGTIDEKNNGATTSTYC